MFSVASWFIPFRAFASRLQCFQEGVTMAGLETKHGLLLIADGLGDRPVPELDGRTPLEFARTPTLDGLVREGEAGLMDPVAPGIRGGSDTGHLAILGYDPYKFYTGRGPFEAMGIGLPV